jgi:hypothetical protein
VEGDGCHVVAEGDFARRRVEEIGEGLPRAAMAASVSMLVGIVPVRVGVVLVKVRGHGFDHVARHLRASGPSK